MYISAYMQCPLPFDHLSAGSQLSATNTLQIMINRHFVKLPLLLSSTVSSMN